MALTATFSQAQTCQTNIKNKTPDSRYQLLNNNSEVKDLKTGLIWQRCSLGQTWSGTSCTGKTTEYEWKAALQAAKKMGSGWRMPNVTELSSLLELACYFPAINEDFFPDTIHGMFWSSSPSAYRSSRVWCVSFYNGGVISNESEYSNQTGYQEGGFCRYVRLVRSGK